MLSPPSSECSLSPLTVPISKSYMLGSINLISFNSLTWSLSSYEANNFFGFKEKMLEGDKYTVSVFCFQQSSGDSELTLPMYKYTFLHF